MYRQVWAGRLECGSLEVSSLWIHSCPPLSEVHLRSMLCVSMLILNHLFLLNTHIDLFTHSPIQRCLSCFQILAFMSNIPKHWHVGFLCELLAFCFGRVSLREKGHPKMNFRLSAVGNSASKGLNADGFTEASLYCHAETIFSKPISLRQNLLSGIVWRNICLSDSQPWNLLVWQVLSRLDFAKALLFLQEELR